jgi:hypothetical protein
MITANASLEGPSSAFILKRSNITFNYEVVFIYSFETNVVTTNGRWFAVSDSNSTLVFQLDSNYDMINEQRLPINGQFINIQLNDVLVLVRDGSIASYQLNQGQWQSIDSLTIPSSSPFRVNFLEDKLVIGWPAGPSSEQICRFYQRNDTSWYLIEELQISFAAVSKALAWNGNDTLLVMNRIMVKQGSLWTTQAYLSSSDSSIYNAAFITETSFIVNEFRVNQSATIYARPNSSELWTPQSLVNDNLQRPTVDSMFQFLIGGEAIVVISLDASFGVVRVLIDEVAEACTAENTVINCDIQLDECQDVTITDYFIINRPCGLVVNPKPRPIQFKNVYGTIILGSLNFTSDGFQYSCNSVIQCPSHLSSPSTGSPDSPSFSNYSIRHNGSCCKVSLHYNKCQHCPIGFHSDDANCFGHCTVEVQPCI